MLIGKEQQQQQPTADADTDADDAGDDLLFFFTNIITGGLTQRDLVSWPLRPALAN